MGSKFKVLPEKDKQHAHTVVSVMGRIIVDGTIPQISAPVELWDVAGNKMKGKSVKLDPTKSPPFRTARRV